MASEVGDLAAENAARNTRGIYLMVSEQDTGERGQVPSNAWNLYVERDSCANVQVGLDREWLVTNGLGGYAAGSIEGATTRSYHGLLVAAHPLTVEGREHQLAMADVLWAVQHENRPLAQERGEDAVGLAGVQ